ncbi:MAG: sigma-70 family RNA polymerase sigma factor [Planctomycetota bacterium]
MSDDVRTLALLRARDPDGLRRLLQDHGGVVLERLRRVFERVQVWVDVDDAVSRAVLRAWDAGPGHDLSQGTLRAWLFVTARNFALAAMRAERRPGLPLDEFLEILAWLDPHPSQQQRLLRIADFQGCIGLLPRLQRLVLQADLDADGTAHTGRLAAQLGTSEQTVLNARAHGRDQIRTMMLRLGHFVENREPTAEAASEPEFGR